MGENDPPEKVSVTSMAIIKKKPLTVGDLRKAIKDLPDEMPAHIYFFTDYDGKPCVFRTPL